MDEMTTMTTMLHRIRDTDYAEEASKFICQNKAGNAIHLWNYCSFM